MMNEAPETKNSYLRRPDVRKHLSRVISARRSRMFGVPEMIGLLGSGFVLLLVVFSYFYFLLPARSRLNELRSDRTQTLANVRTLEGVLNEGTTTRETVDKIAASLANFENSGLERQEAGRMGLYEELNRLIVSNGLRNTAGPTYTALEPSGTQVTAGRSVATKWQSVYPGVAVMVTVEGQYQSIRHFIQDIERSKLFVVINEIEIQKAQDNSSHAVAAAEASGGGRGSLVSLQLNLATYFQRNESNSESSRK